MYKDAINYKQDIISCIEELSSYSECSNLLIYSNVLLSWASNTFEAIFKLMPLDYID